MKEYRTRVWLGIVGVVGLLILGLLPSIAESVAQKGSPIVGTVVNVGDYLTGGEGTVSKQEAIDLVERGQLLGVVSGGTLYLVFHPDGSYAGKKLAKMAGHSVGIVGKVVRRYGSAAIVADLIEVMR